MEEKRKTGAGRRKPGGESPLAVRDRALELPREGPRPVYLLHGDEGYLAEDTARRLIEKIVPGERREYGLETLSGPSVTVAQLSGALASMPLFGRGERVVWARGCEIFRDAGRADAVRAMLPAKGCGTTLVITEERADRRFSLYREIERRGAVCEFGRLSDMDSGHLRALHELVSARLAPGGRAISFDALLYLVQLVGTDLRAVFAEMEKLDLHAPPGAGIGKGDIDVMVSPSREMQAFQLADAVLSRDVRRSLAMLDRLLAQGVSPLAILATLTNLTRHLLQIRDLLDEGALRGASSYPAFKAAIEAAPAAHREAYKSAGQNYRKYSIFGQHPYVVFKMAAHAGRMTAGGLRRRLDLLVKANPGLKHQRQRGGALLEGIVIELCGAGALTT